MKQKRVNKTKDQLVAEKLHKQDINKQKAIVKALWPLIEGQKTIYDAQTVVNAISGFIKYGLDKKMNDFKVNDIEIALGKEENTAVKVSVVDILALIGDENAKDMASLTERLGNSLAQFGVAQFLKGPMANIKVTDIVSD